MDTTGIEAATSAQSSGPYAKSTSLRLTEVAHYPSLACFFAFDAGCQPSLANF